MKRIMIALFILTLCLTAFQANAQNTWSLLNEQTTSLITEAITFADIVFTDESNGYAAGSNGMMAGGIFKSTDGGANWQLVHSTGMFDQFVDLDIVNASTMWAAGKKGTGKKLLLYKSADGGASWSTQTLPVDVAAFGIHFTDANTGYAMVNESYVGKIYKTTDGGASWSTVFDGTTGDGWTVVSLSCYAFPSTDNIWVAGQKGYVIHSTDAGASWNYVDISSNANINGISFTDANHGWMVGSSDVMYTSDGGSTWSKTELNLNESFLDVHFVTDQQGWAVGGISGVNKGMIYSSIDGGVSWELDTIESTSDLAGLFFLNETLGWAYGNYATVHQYNSAGTTVSANDPPVPDVKLNNEDGPLSLSSTQALSVTISLDPASHAGDSADWWVLLFTPTDTEYLSIDPADPGWKTGLGVTCQGSLLTLPVFEIFNKSNMTTGTYMFAFGVDLKMDGQLDTDPSSLFYDAATVTVY